MPVLVIQHEKNWRAGLLRGRVLIGRWSINHIAIEDQNVSKLHAWITGGGENYTITDGDSYNGTYVNNQRITSPWRLNDKDRIRIGPAVMIFAEASILPPGFQIVDLTPRLLDDSVFPGGFIVECKCGAPLLVKETLKGKTGVCRFCRQTHLLVPRQASGLVVPPNASLAASAAAVASLAQADELIVPAPNEIAMPAIVSPIAENPPAEPPVPAKQTQKKKLCSVCQSAIAESDAVTRCPSCGMAFHAECWLENRGCAAYGCAQVGALEPKTDDGDMVEQSQNDERF